MPLATILGMYFLLGWPQVSIVSSVSAAAIWQGTQSQENQSGDSAPQGSSAPSPPDQQKAPDQPAPPPQTPTATAQPCPENTQPGSTVKPDCKPGESAGTKTKKRHRAHKTVAPATTSTEMVPSKTVVRNGGTEDPTVDLSPRMNPQKALQQSESTKQLLAASDANLNKISGRSLNANQQDTVKQIKSYMDQAKGALSDGDAQRAYNLALKANLLSAELVGH
jgi:type IV secretory pathway VirB10-like protein